MFLIIMELTDKELDLLFDFAGLQRNEPSAFKAQLEPKRRPVGKR